MGQTPRARVDNSSSLGSDERLVPRHPGPLPVGEGESSPTYQKSNLLHNVDALGMVPPLLRERAGVRGKNALTTMPGCIGLRCSPRFALSF